MSVLSKPYFHDEEAAFRFVEGIIWSQGPVCPKCGGVARIGAIKANPEKRVRYGLRKCGQCKAQFTVRMGAIFEESKLPLHKWLQAIYLMCSSKKGISAKQLERTLEVTYKTAWFLAHRIREAMRSGELAPFGQGGGAVEVDETYIGVDPDHPVKEGHKARTPNKNKVVSLIDRSTGRAKSYVVDRVDVATVAEILSANVSREARLMSDQAAVYKHLGWNFAEHGVVDHGRDEYVSKLDRTVHTQTIEGYFSIFKRGMKGVYQHCSKKHLHRYMAEFDFRYSNRSATGCEDQERAFRAVLGGVGKRLTYRGGACLRPQAAGS
jgi:transposase-like protein